MQQRRTEGFTIVELLIVIVVIGILAAITVVAYTGVQNRARSAQLLSAVDAYEKAVRMYIADHDGQVPETYAADGSGPGQVCLGENYQNADGFANNLCTNPDWGSTVAPSSSINAALKSYLSQLPDVSKNTFSLTGIPYSRGLIYSGDNRVIAVGPVFSIIYFVDGDQTCGRGAKSVLSPGGKTITQCVLIVR